MNAHGNTSASAPVAAGAGALVYEMYDAGVFEDVSGQNTSGTPSPAMAKALLLNSAHTFPAENIWDDELLGGGGCGTDERDPHPRNTRDIQGAGQPNLTVYQGEAGASTWTLDEDFALDSGDYVNATVTLPDWAGAVRVSLTWTDPPTQPILNNVPMGNLTAAADGKLVRGPGTGVVHRALVNDLDLVVEGPDGTTYPGNHGRANDTESKAGNNVEDRDRVNNFETVSSTDPETGSTEEWTVQVQATSIMQDAAHGEAFGQPFALVVRPVDVPEDGSTRDERLWERETTRVLYGQQGTRHVGIFVTDKPGTTSQRLAEVLDIAVSTVRHHLSKLRNHSLIERIRLGRGVEYFPTDTLEEWLEEVGYRYDVPWKSRFDSR